MNNVFKIFKKEIRETFRDKKSLMMMLMIPLFIPLVVIGFSALFDFQTDKEESDIKNIIFTYELTDVEKQIAESLDIVTSTDTEEILREKLENDEIDFYISRSDDKDPNKFIINHKSSGYNTAYVELFFESYKTYVENLYLVDNNIDPTEFMNLVTIEENIIGEDDGEFNFFANYMVQYSFIFIIMAITISTSYPATDATAGERERGTLETLLTFPIKSKDIILGKYLSITTSAVVTGVISLLLAIISLYIAGNSFKIYEDVNMMLSLENIIIAVICIIVYSFMISGLCIAIASKSKTFKEAQSALSPVQFISFFPGFIAFMIGIENSLILSLVPFLNVTMVFSDSVSGNLNILSVVAMLISSFVLISILLMIIIKQYKSEKVLFVK